MAVKLSVAIMAVPERKDRVNALLRKLGNWTIPVKVLYDEHHNGPWYNWQRAALEQAPGATHHLILQDDIIPSQNFLAAARRAIEANPNVPISFFSTRKGITEARQRGKSWAKSNGGQLMAQAWSFPLDILDKILRFTSDNPKVGVSVPRGGGEYDDVKVMTALSYLGYDMWNTVPSLVDHDLDTKSSLGSSPQAFGRPRRAAQFIGENHSGVGIDWSKGLDDPGRV